MRAGEESVRISFGNLTMLVQRWEEREEARPATSRKARKWGVWVELVSLGSVVGGGVAMNEYAAAPKEYSAKELKA
jgi:hypothetical protein